jgi:zinc protease
MNRIAIALSVLLPLGPSACSQESGPAQDTNITSSPATMTDKPVSPALPKGVRLVERYEGDDSGISIPFTKYELDNGLTVVLHEDHSDPMARVDVTYHVGSAREEPGRSGFAHFFEHMMFEGSKHVPDGRFDEIITGGGGSLNGSTNTDRTNYYENIPANQLEPVLWLEADRMGFLLDAVTQEKFEVQRETVKNERGQRIDNRPYGRWKETMDKALYPQGHPYSWPTIGWIEDLNRADLDDLKNFFLRWYGPNNAVLTIGGDIDVAETLESVVKYFGSIPRGPEVKKMQVEPFSIEADRYITMEDNVHLPGLFISMPTVRVYHEDEPALDVAAKILGQGQASLLYQRLVQTGRAVQASVSHFCKEHACEMTFVVIQNPASGETLAEMATAVRETIAEFTDRGVSEDDLLKFKAQYEAGEVFRLQSVSGKVASLAQLETFKGSPAGKGEEIEKYLSVEVDDVTRVFKQYIDGQPAVILSVVPHGQPQLAAAMQNFQSPDPALPEHYADEGHAPALRVPVDNFDRSLEPIPGVNPQVELPAIWDRTLTNGVRVLAVPNTETPTVTLLFTFEVGQRDEPPGKAGLTAMMAALMRETTQQRSAAEFSEELERIGAFVSVNPGTYATTVSVNVLAKHLGKAMRLARERMLEPAFTQEDFDRIKQRTLESLVARRKTPAGLANRAVEAVLSGPEHIMSYPISGIPRTVESITLDDVKAFYRAHIPSRLSGIMISTSLPLEETIAHLEEMAALETSEVIREPLAERPISSGRTLYLVNKEGAAQSSLRTAQNAIPYDALGDFYRAGLANFVLGGTFHSRINQNLREDKGYTYSARTYFSGGPELGTYRFSSEVNREATTASLQELFAELDRYVESGMSEEDFEFMRSAIGQREAMQYETPGAKLGLLANIMRYDLPLNYRTLQKNILQESEREALNELASRLIEPGNMSIVVVGDEATLSEELETLGLPIVRLDEDGYVIED